MRAIKKAKRLIAANPVEPAAATFSRLLASLESQTPFDLHELYLLDYHQFELAQAVLSEWRLDRYYTSKGSLLDSAWNHQQLHQTTQASRLTN